MIERSQVVSLVIEKIPSFREPYDKWFEQEGTALIEGNNEQEKADFLTRARKGDSSGVPIYLMPLPNHLLKLHQQGNITELETAAELIEQCVVDGDQYVSEWAVIGVLEGIQNGWSEYGSEKFIPYLKPKSLEAWNELDDFWMQTGKFERKDFAEHYRNDEKWRRGVDHQILSDAKGFLSGEKGAIGTARQLAKFKNQVSGANPALGDVLARFEPIVMETRNVKLPPLDKPWHLAVSAITDEMVIAAEAQHRKTVQAVCTRIIELIGSEHG